MAHEHLYEPVPCSYWLEDLLYAVGTAYREARGQGLEGGVSLDHAEAAYIGAGDAATDARTLVLGILASLSVRAWRLAVGAGASLARSTATRCYRPAGSC